MNSIDISEDMMQRVEVDQNCLTTGRIQSPNYCPVAIALERAGLASARLATKI